VTGADVVGGLGAGFGELHGGPLFCLGEWVAGTYGNEEF
jgi:hypothetical protein